MKGKKTKNRGILQVLREGPMDIYGESNEERDCVRIAEDILIKAKEPEDYRRLLLNNLISYKMRVVRNDEAISL